LKERYTKVKTSRHAEAKIARRKLEMIKVEKKSQEPV